MIKLKGYKWNKSQDKWEGVWFPRCGDVGYSHNVYRHHIGWYGPFGHSVGECKGCDYGFKGGIEEAVGVWKRLHQDRVEQVLKDMERTRLWARQTVERETKKLELEIKEMEEASQ